MTENQSKALSVLVQSFITAILLFVQSFFFQGCMSAQGDIHKTTNTDISISVPEVSFSDYHYLQSAYPRLYQKGCEFLDISPVNISFFDDVLVPAYEQGLSESALISILNSGPPYPVYNSR